MPSTKVPNSAKTWLRCCGIANHGLLDYVACWHVLAARYMQANPQMACALVSTNSICQGEQVGVLWPHLLGLGMRIQFAHRTFQWSNEGKGAAAVHCIIVGFGPQPPAQAVLYDYSADIKAAEGERLAVARINPYLVDGPRCGAGPARASRCARCRKWALATNPLTAATTCLPRKKKPIFCCKSRALRRIFGAGWERRSFSTASNAGVCGWAMPLLPLWPLWSLP